MNNSYIHVIDVFQVLIDEFKKFNSTYLPCPHKESPEAPKPQGQASSDEAVTRDSKTITMMKFY